MKVFLVAGARPNFMKIAPLYRVSKTVEEVTCKIVHTGQHYDYEMSQAFFDDLELPEPDYFLDAGSGSHAVQTANIMIEFEKVLKGERPDYVVVVGDVNSTLACSVVAKKQLVKVAHVEAGLRSRDMEMPEEINRIVTDAIADLFFVTEQSGIDNLLQEGKPAPALHLVGHVMIDNLLHQVERLATNGAQSLVTYPLKSKYPEYCFMTLHRPSNVDSETVFKGIAGALNRIAEEFPIFFPVHPRTRKMMDNFNIRFSDNIICLKPLGFREALYLWQDAVVVITDSGGLQEETTGLGVPCVTIRENTERPITVQMGSNVLAGTSHHGILAAFRHSVNNRSVRKKPPLWDGMASHRIWEIMCQRGKRNSDGLSD
ncbi:MAG: UDP-N-acetylglucosamine 2-epimerase (non-hydrolyzing) [Desulfobacteraceae bacterium]|jgi:UDP-N-acetylglucosamine 2-epimerase (non-hydrolysing)